MTPWDHQPQAVNDVLAALERGERRILLTSPTGGGKSYVAQQLARHFLDRNMGVSLYSNRRLLIEQLSRGLDLAGMAHGIRAAGHEGRPDELFQVSSIQTEASRVLKRKLWELHKAALVLVDEAHLHGGVTAQQILRRHVEQGAAIVGLTATPIDLGHMYDTLIVAGTTSELRACGALIPALHYGPDEPDLKRFKALREGEDLSEKQQREAMGPKPQLWGRVWEWFCKLNPERRPTILFAPGVAESVWFAQEFSKQGIWAAHLDGADVWIDGELHKTSSELRKEILEESRSGQLAVLCNRFVLREGIDLPHLAHGIFATVFGSLQSYLQAGGRLLRAHPGLERVVIQDHGGNWHRHGSLNADREWRLELTGPMIAGLRADRLRNKAETGEKEPYRCPACGMILMGPRCHCGYQGGKRSRPVVQADGSLKELSGDIFRPRRISQHPEGPDLWRKMYHRSRTGKGRRTFRAAAALFAYENNFAWPDPSWPLMPKQPEDWFRHVEDVPPERLTR